MSFLSDNKGLVFLLVELVEGREWGCVDINDSVGAPLGGIVDLTRPVLNILCHVMSHYVSWLPDR